MTSEWSTKEACPKGLVIPSPMSIVDTWYMRGLGQLVLSLKWWYDLGYSPSSDAIYMTKSHFSGHVRLHHGKPQFSTYATSKRAILENIKSSDCHIQFDPWHYIHWSQVSFAMLQKYQGLLMKRSGWKGNDSDVINQKFLKNWYWDKKGHKKYCFKCKDASYWIYMMQRWHWHWSNSHDKTAETWNLLTSTVLPYLTFPTCIDFWILQNEAFWCRWKASYRSVRQLSRKKIQPFAVVFGGGRLHALSVWMQLGKSHKSLQQNPHSHWHQSFFRGKHCIQCLPFKTSVEKPRTKHRNTDYMSPTTISSHSFWNWATGSVRNNHTKTTHWRSDIVNPTATLLCAH